MPMPMPLIKVVKWEGEFYIHFNNLPKRKGVGTLLINRKGKVVRGPTRWIEMEQIRTIPCFKIGTWWFFKTKIGVFNAVTGERR